jgi:thioredoxin reductase (NADPH)
MPSLQPFRWSGKRIAAVYAWTAGGSPREDQKMTSTPLDTDAPSEAFPELTTAELARLRAYGAAEQVAVGDAVFQAGDTSYDLIVIDEGVIDIVRPATRDAPEDTVVRHRAGRFLGELNLLTGQIAYLTARVVEAGRIHRISPEQFRRLMADDPELSDVLLRAFLARRELLRHGPAARSVEIVGSGMSASALALRTYAARQRLPHLWFDSDNVAGQALMNAVDLGPSDLPAVLTPDRILRRATPGEFAEHLGLSYKRAADRPVDLTVIGAGPAGLAAALYGASEGLATVLLDAVGTGGQAAASSRIENYLGFPSGLSGADLTGRAAVQALKFGAQLSSPCQAVSLDASGALLRVVLEDGTDISTRAVVIATGARYRALPLDRWADFEGAGIYYAATELEARACDGHPVAVVGGANSAGQAALYLATRGTNVTLVVRGADISAGMSSYLVDRLVAEPKVAVRTTTEVTGLAGSSSLDTITLTDRSSGESHEQPCHGLFCFIGAYPATTWLTGVAVDQDGFIRTDVQLDSADLGDTWASLGRLPLPFETSIPAVFAAGDVRLGSMKRVAAAVGEGASAVRSVHTAIGIRT